MKKEEKDMVFRMVFGFIVVVLVAVGVYFIPEYFYAPAPNSEEAERLAVGDIEEYYAMVEGEFIDIDNEIINGVVVKGEKPDKFNILVLTIDGKVHSFQGENLMKEDYSFETIDSLEHITHIQPKEDNVYFLSPDYVEYISKKDLLAGEYNLQESEVEVSEEFDDDSYLYYDGLTEMDFE